ncbi:hypothetical protein MSG28_013836 [Choristoneura fumiferana]|uniref:Uncharacterized protein n=1 Tax=Choristoneura fumiferana TaxID=7141 RepID=A0ACC0K8Z4_CHOFU|nr:hypothetical protein MSG28_013836 [Choristoneura fumiferana]
MSLISQQQEYDDDDYSEIQNTVESGSREVFNVSRRGRPERVVKLLNGNRLKVAGVKRVRTPKSTWRPEIEITDPEPTESVWITESERTKEPTWRIEATEKPIWRIDAIESKTLKLNERTKHNRRPREPQWTIVPATEPTEEITEATEEVMKVTRKAIGYRSFNAKRFKSADDSNEEYKTTKEIHFKEQHHTQATHADEEHKEPLVNYPFAVSIQRMGSHYASGALVDKKWVLTSAGEFHNVRESIKIYRARLGSVDCKKGGTVVPLMSIEIHPSFVPGRPNYDIAMIRLAVLVDFTDYIHPIGLTKIQDKVLSAKFLTTYWPRVVIKGQVLPPTAKEREKHNRMRVSTQRLVPWDKCYQRLTHQKESLAESSLCLRPVIAHHTTCMPDVGAPVIANDGLWGITSGWISKDCTTARHPSPIVVARVSSPTVRSWLNSLLLAPEN